MDSLRTLSRMTTDLDPKTGRDPAVERVKSSTKTLVLELGKAAFKLLTLVMLGALLGSVILLGMGWCLRMACLLLHLLFPTLMPHLGDGLYQDVRRFVGCVQPSGVEHGHED